MKDLILFIGVLCILPLLVHLQNVHVAKPLSDQIYFPSSNENRGLVQTRIQSGFAINASEENIQSIVTQFSWELFRNSKLPNDLDNLVLSPVMIQILLSVLKNAADGETLSQLEAITGHLNIPKLLQLMESNPGRHQTQLETATGIFADSNQKLNQTFASQAKKFNVEVVRVRFSQGDTTKAAINGWASHATHGLIPKLFNDAYDLSGLKLALTSAIYFHSTWKNTFSPIGTEVFYTENKVAKQVEFMHLHQDLVGDTFRLNNELTGTFIEIPYMNDAYSMIIMLPDPKFTLDSLIKNMKSDQLQDLWNVLPREGKRGIHLRMPKFSLVSHFSVTNALLKMGLVDLFTIKSKLPFLVPRDELRVNDILQQSVMRVNENGTTAAAASVALVIPLSADGIQEQVITVNRPFLAVIFDKHAKIPLFIAKIYDP